MAKRLPNPELVLFQTRRNVPAAKAFRREGLHRADKPDLRRQAYGDEKRLHPELEVCLAGREHAGQIAASPSVGDHPRGSFLRRGDRE